MGYGSCDGNVTAAINKTHNLAQTAWFYLGRKKIRVCKAKPRAKGRLVSYRKIRLTTVAVTRDLLSRMPLVL